MHGFTDLELAALRSIFAETPNWTAKLTEQLLLASVVKRENSGSGFFTTIAVADGAPRLDVNGLNGPISSDMHARIHGLEYDMGFLIFLQNGLLSMLEGFAYQESTQGWDLGALEFDIYKAKVHRS